MKLQPILGLCAVMASNAGPAQPGPIPEVPPKPKAVVLLAASQPDIVRSIQKDDMYQQQAAENLYELIRSTCGAFTALQYSREIAVAAQLLYHGLTTGTGMSTLGEEYCNMAQVSGHQGHNPGLSSRAALVLIRSLGPYLTESLLSRFDRQQQEHLDALNQEPFPWSSQAHTQPDPRPLCDTPSHPSQCSWEDSDQEQRLSTESVLGSSSSSSKRQPGTHLDPAKVARRLLRRLQAAPSAAKHMLSQALAAMKPHIRPALPYLTRLHLALFYLYGTYYTIPHRLAGVRYISIARPLQGRPSYRVLGVLMVVQLVLLAAYQGRQSLLALAEQATAAATGLRLGVGSTSLKHAVMVEEDSRGEQEAGHIDDEASLTDWARVNARGSLDVPSASGAAATSSASHEPPAGRASRQQPSPQQQWVEPLVVMSGRPCPLCLSPRKHPTSTPCGHVFCWSCVAQWCNEKPECPLCRSKVLLPQLVPVYHCTHF